MEGGRLHGSWVLARMAQDRNAKPGEKRRTNWLLIKHKDEDRARPGDHDALLAEDASSDRLEPQRWRQIAAGAGSRAPNGFHAGH